jgi:hypothetical protein
MFTHDAHLQIQNIYMLILQQSVSLCRLLEFNEECCNKSVLKLYTITTQFIQQTGIALFHAISEKRKMGFLEDKEIETV